MGRFLVSRATEEKDVSIGFMIGFSRIFLMLGWLSLVFIDFFFFLTEFQRILSGLLLGFTGLYWVILSFTGFYLV